MKALARGLLALALAVPAAAGDEIPSARRVYERVAEQGARYTTLPRSSYHAFQEIQSSQECTREYLALVPRSAQDVEPQLSTFVRVQYPGGRELVFLYQDKGLDGVGEGDHLSVNYSAQGFSAGASAELSRNHEYELEFWTAHPQRNGERINTAEGGLGSVIARRKMRALETGGKSRFDSQYVVSLSSGEECPLSSEETYELFQSIEKGSVEVFESPAPLAALRALRLLRQTERAIDELVE